MLKLRRCLDAFFSLEQTSAKSAQRFAKITVLGQTYFLLYSRFFQGSLNWFSNQETLY